MAKKLATIRGAISDLVKKKALKEGRKRAAEMVKANKNKSPRDQSTKFLRAKIEAIKTAK